MAAPQHRRARRRAGPPAFRTVADAVRAAALDQRDARELRERRGVRVDLSAWWRAAVPRRRSRSARSSTSGGHAAPSAGEWVAVFDDAARAHYYHSAAAGESTWGNPARAGRGRVGWCSTPRPAGRTHNERTGETRWDSRGRARGSRRRRRRPRPTSTPRRPRPPDGRRPRPATAPAPARGAVQRRPRLDVPCRRARAARGVSTRRTLNALQLRALDLDPSLASAWTARPQQYTKPKRRTATCARASSARTAPAPRGCASSASSPRAGPLRAPPQGRARAARRPRPFPSTGAPARLLRDNVEALRIFGVVTGDTALYDKAARSGEERRARAAAAEADEACGARAGGG